MFKALVYGLLLGELQVSLSTAQAYDSSAGTIIRISESSL